MAIKRVSVSPQEYVVLDVETNGLSSLKDDLLSISFYKPDTQTSYERFLPLDLNSRIAPGITAINGITKKKIRNKQHLTQDEVDALFDDFELGTRTILHYGSIDEKFIRNYFKRHNLSGYERMNFYNFKHQICASSFSSGVLSKDNLCRMFKIKGVQEVHTGLNDCKLEWQLFEALEGRHLLVTESNYWNTYDIFELSENYIVPVTYLANYPNLSKLFARPWINHSSEEIYRFSVPGNGVTRFSTNFTGLTIEHLINVMLGAERINSDDFLIKNKSRLKWLGQINSNREIVAATFNKDGTVTVRDSEYEDVEKELNRVALKFKKQLEPLISFLKKEVLKNKPVFSQELVVDESLGVLALCDLSTEDVIIEIKTSYNLDFNKIAEQLHYQANGRLQYVLSIQWNYSGLILETVDFIVHKVVTAPGEKTNKVRERALGTLNKALEGSDISIVKYEKSALPIELLCNKCSTQWQEKYYAIRHRRDLCPTCHPQAIRRKRVQRSSVPRALLAEEYKKRYIEKVQHRSNNQITINPASYVGSKEKVEAVCMQCGRTWKPRADKLLAKCYCVSCRRKSFVEGDEFSCMGSKDVDEVG